MADMEPPQQVTPASATPAPKLLESFDREAQASVGFWRATVSEIRGTLNLNISKPNAPERSLVDEGLRGRLAEWDAWGRDMERAVQQAKQKLDALGTAMDPVVTLSLQVQETLKAKQATAALGVTIVSAFPPDRVSEVTGIAATALTAAGGFAYEFGGTDHTPAIVAWTLAIALFVATVAARAAHQIAWRSLFRQRLEGL